jgi:hypothetical protein
VDARRIYRPQDRNGLASHFDHVYYYLRFANVSAQQLVELLLGLLYGEPRNMNAPHKRNLYVALPVDADGFVRGIG